MRFLSFPKSFAVLSLGALLISPTSSFADRKISVWRDRDGDGHFNRKTIRIPSRHGHGGHHHRYYGGHRSYHHHRYFNRPYLYDYGYYRPYSYYYRPSFGLSFYSEPVYYPDRNVYRTTPRSSESYGDSLAADVQQALKRRGYYKGSIDGNIGPASRSAIRAYQSDRGLSVTGRVDRSLLESLGIG